MAVAVLCWGREGAGVFLHLRAGNACIGCKFVSWGASPGGAGKGLDGAGSSTSVGGLVQHALMLPCLSQVGCLPSNGITPRPWV